MTDQTTTDQATLQSALCADVSATVDNPLGPEACEADRIARIKVLERRAQENNNELARLLHRLGRELKALRDQTEYGRWEKLFDTELTFISKRRANDYIALAQAFKTEEEMVGLPWLEALSRARGSPGNAHRVPRAPVVKSRSYIRKLAAFHKYLDRAELDEITDQLAASDRDEAIAHWAAIAQAANEAISRLNRPGQSTPAGAAACALAPARSAKPGAAESSQPSERLLEGIGSLKAMFPAAPAKPQGRQTLGTDPIGARPPSPRTQMRKVHLAGNPRQARPQRPMPLRFGCTPARPERPPSVLTRKPTRLNWWISGANQAPDPCLRGRSSIGLEHRLVTPKVAGSSPVGLVGPPYRGRSHLFA